MMTFEQAINKKIEADEISTLFSNQLQEFPSQQNGLLDEEVANSDEYKNIKRKFDKWFKELQTINKFIMKQFKKEYNAYRKTKRGY